MPTGIAWRAAIPGQLAKTGAHRGPALAAFIGYLAARLQDNGLVLRAVAKLIKCQRCQVLQIWRKKGNTN